MVRDFHDSVLSNYAIPAYVVATKPSSCDEIWLEGEKRDLRHDAYLIRTEDPTKVRNPDRVFSFDQVVDLHGVRLNDLEGDLVTSKIFVLEHLRGQFLYESGARTLLTDFHQLLWVIRWRNSLSFSKFSALSLALFEDFCERAKRGNLGLIPFEERLAAICGDVEAGRWHWPIYKIQSRTRLNSEIVAARLGLPGLALTRGANDKVISAVQRSYAGPLHFSSVGDQVGDERGLSSAQTYLNVWRDLYQLSLVGCLSHDPLRFDPFQTLDIGSRARRIGTKPSKRTRTLGPEEWIGLLDAAARWVLDYAAPILAIVDYAVLVERQNKHLSVARRSVCLREAVQREIDRRFPPKDGRIVLLPMWYRAGAAAGMEGTSLNEAVKHLATACLVLIGGLSARRAGEIDSLQVGCVTADAFGEHWLSTYIEKTIRDIDQIPVPATVLVSVEILERLSASGRARTGEPWLMNIDRPNAVLGEYSERIGFDLSLRKTMNEFAEVSGLCLPDGAENWSFTSHQLRRAFAIYYYHGNRYSCFDALSRFLRHFDPEVTRLYITEILRGQLARFAEVAEANAKIARDIEERGDTSEEAVLAATSASALANAASQAHKDARDRLAVHEDVRQEAGFERCLDVYDGVENPIGLGASSLRDDLEMMVEKARIHVRFERPSANGSPDEIRDAFIRQLREYVKTHFLEPVSGGFSHCRCAPGSDSQLEQAVCLQRKSEVVGDGGDRRPDYAYASIEDCLACPHGIALSENQRKLHEVADRANMAVEGRGHAIADNIIKSLQAAHQAASAKKVH